MKLAWVGCLAGVITLCVNAPTTAHAEAPSSGVHGAFEDSLKRFGVNHDNAALRTACDHAVSADSNYALPQFYLGVLDEADENWPAAQKHFQEFLSLEGSSDLSASARRELAKLPTLIREDSTPSGKLDRRYRQDLGYANLLEKQGFAKEALLETAGAAKLAPSRWEAYAVASSILLGQHQFSQAQHFLDLAKQHAPTSANERLKVLGAEIKRQPTH